MTRSELLTTLTSLHRSEDPETAHSDADEALLAFIADEEITAAFVAVPRWYA